MSSWGTKNSNKKSDYKQISTQNENISSTIENDETSALLKHQKQTSTSKQIRNFFCFGTSMIQKEEQQQHIYHSMTDETTIGWEQILDREFQSLDIDADGYVSIDDLQSVLR